MAEYRLWEGWELKYIRGVSEYFLPQRFFEGTGEFNNRLAVALK